MSGHLRRGVIRDINGPIVTIDMPGIRNGEQVKLGELGLFGEVISLQGERAVVQSYESTEGMRPGGPAIALGRPLSVELGPGLLGGIFDGVQRPLKKIALDLCGHHTVKHPEPSPAIDRSNQSSGAAVVCPAPVKIHFSFGRAPAVLDGDRVVDKGGIYVSTVFYLSDPGITEKPGNRVLI
ncbi:MAG: hypothetical protein P8X90_18930 [Desulfobacterales bacterium]